MGLPAHSGHDRPERRGGGAKLARRGVERVSRRFIPDRSALPPRHLVDGREFVDRIRGFMATKIRLV